MKSILVFGATGNTGLQVIEQSLAKGIQVTAFVRNSTKLNDFPKLQIIKGDLFNLKSIASALEVAKPDAIISCIGVHGTKPWTRTTLYSKTITNISSAIQSVGATKRMVCISSWGAQKSKDNAWFLDYLLKPTIFAGFIYDMKRMEDFLFTSNLDYTIVRPPGLTDKPATSKLIIEPNRTQNSRGKWTITRADLAAIMINAVEKNLYVKQAVAVANI